MEQHTIGFIGLGIMGQPMAMNLLRAGYSLAAYARRPETLQPLTAAGAETCGSAAELADRCRILFTMVAETADVEQVVLGDNGLMAGAGADSIVVDMSTISPETTREIAARLQTHQVHMLDAPVSGGEQGAIDGTLSIMVGGEKTIFRRVLPLFESMGKNIVHVGANGAGQVAKACNQILVAQTIAAVAEALQLARSAGADPARVREALLGGFANSKILEAHGQRMLDDNFQPGFKARLHRKDMRIALDSAASRGLDLAGARRAAQHLDALVELGDGELDSAAIDKIIRAQSGA